jgi:hypothetical protein
VAWRQYPSGRTTTGLAPPRLLESGIDIRTVQFLRGHADVSKPRVYLNVMKRPGTGAPSPLDLP